MTAGARLDARRPEPGRRTAGTFTTESVEPEEALARVLQGLTALPAHEVSLSESLDCVLAETVVAEVPLPGFDNSAMDGYAVRAVDAEGGRRLRVVGDVRAGESGAVCVGRGEACRVMTGAPVPDGADTVVPFEITRTPDSGGVCATTLTQLAPPWIEVLGPVSPGRHVRRTGEDVPAGQVLALPGTVVRPADIALLSAIGRRTVQVTRAPVVAVLSTGDELSGPGEPVGPGGVLDVNGPALAALVRRAGGIPVLSDPVPDSTLALLERLEALAGSVDLVLTSGGASGGVADIVAGLTESPHEVEPLSVRMRPGKPLVSGRLMVSSNSRPRQVPLVGLPGNPVAAMVSFEVFVVPAIARLRGLRHDGVRVVQAVSADELRATPGRVSFARVRVERDAAGQLVASSTGAGCGHGTGSLLGSNGLAVVAGDSAGVRPGEMVAVRMTGWSA